MAVVPVAPFPNLLTNSRCCGRTGVLCISEPVIWMDLACPYKLQTDMMLISRCMEVPDCNVV